MSRRTGRRPVKKIWRSIISTPGLQLLPLGVALLLAYPPRAIADAPIAMPAMEITAAPGLLIGEATAASEGTVTQREIEARPSLRPADVLELVPGMIVTQHSGAGKANQYFLRGFNLDHGTDFLTRVMGMPVNMPTHAHGQGYTDLNFLIPELVQRLDYHKGPYYAEVGDFASVGFVDMEYFRVLPRNFALLEVGNYDFWRGLGAATPRLGNGNLLVAGEVVGDNGPWDVPQDYRKLNGVLSYSQGTLANGWSLTAMGYRAKWNSTDQIPKRALDQGLVGRFGSLDPTDGGESWRYSFSGRWARSDANSATLANAWFIGYSLDLYSNFTYVLDNPDKGDQFEQRDRRQVSGVDLAQKWLGEWGSVRYENAVGFSTRNDRIRPVGLYLTSRRERFDTVRQDNIDQWSVALWAQNDTRWTPWLRTVAGLRGERFDFDVSSSLPENSGRESAQKLLPKFSLILGPWARTEVYANYGQGFHSNDARGTTTRVNPDPRDPGFLGPVAPVTPLAGTVGYELGLRSAPFAGFQTTLAVWRLDLDSELLFVGDAGTTEPSRPSRRQGVEWYAYYSPVRWFAADLMAAWTQARFTDPDPVGDRIPGAIESAAAGGITLFPYRNWFGSLRFRYFGARPLVEDNSVRSSTSLIWNLRGGYQVTNNWQVALDVINLFNAKVSDIEYFYESRLPLEPGPVADIHLHPAVPRTVRLAVKYAM